MAVHARQEDWAPNWATHPGEHLAEHIEARGYSQAELARLAGLTPKLVSTIIAGRNPVTPETALKLERALGVRAYVWLNLQANWDLFKARGEETARGAGSRKGSRPIAKEAAKCGSGRIGAVMEQAAKSGLLGEKDRRIGGRVSSALIERAKARTGLRSDTELLAYALANVALEDRFGEALGQAAGTVDPDLDIEF